MGNGTPIVTASPACSSARLAELHAGEAVTIGVPLPNYALFVIAPEVEEKGLVLLPRGETGELCISGPGVAAGYLGRPELTAEKFLANPWSTNSHDARLYRTGDLARIDADGRVQCFGRADDQVKIRGFRVELGEIEAVLAEQPGIGTVAVLLRPDEGIDQLIAFIVPDASLSIGALHAALGARLPPYMVPSRFEVLDQMPRLTSGKIDRKALKSMPLAPAVEAEGSDTAETPLEEALFNALSKLFPGLPIRRDADFFADLGGHSLFAARLASTLRADPRFTHVTVRDIYQHRVIGRIAAALQAAPSAGQALQTPDWVPPPFWRRWVCGVAQAAAVPGLVALRMSQWLAPFFTYHFFTGAPEDSIPFAITMSVLMFMVATVLEFAVAIGAKWLIAGRIAPGRYPLWGMVYFRWWLVDRLIDAAPTYFISGASLHTWWWRALGARIGSDVVIGSIKLRAPDLFSVGDGASIGNAVNFENARVEHGQLVLGPIDIAANAHVGSYAVLEGGTRVGEWGHLDGQSALCQGQSVPPRRLWIGSPARDGGPFDPASLPPRPPVSARRISGEGIFFVIGAMLVAVLFFLPVFPTFMVIDKLDDIELFSFLDTDSSILNLGKYFILALPASAVMIVLTALISAGIRWSVMPRLKPGSWAVHSNVYCGKWLVNQIQETSLQVLHGVVRDHLRALLVPLAGRQGRPRCGNFHGARRGARHADPGRRDLHRRRGAAGRRADRRRLDDDAADRGVSPQLHRQRRLRAGRDALARERADRCALRVPDRHDIRSGDTWVGSPAMHLPARETVTGHPEELTYRPSWRRRVGRGVIEAFRIVAPHAIVISAGYSIVLAVMPSAAAGHWGAVVSYLTIDGLIFGLSTFVFVAAFKWLLLGRYKPRAVAMWTPFVWLSEAATNLYEGIAVPNFLSYLRGTPWLPLAMRLLGCKIGRGVYLDTTDMTEFDCVHIGAFSEINAMCCPQTHLFEDRVMKIDRVRIGERVTIGARSTVLYGASVQDRSQLGPLTLVMKGESIPGGAVWTGNPAMPALTGYR